MKPTMWDFKKENDEWKAELSADWLFYMEATEGFPHEMLIDEIKKMDILKIMESKRKSWVEFAKKNKIDLEPIREKNLKLKDEFKKLYNEHLKTL